MGEKQMRVDEAQMEPTAVTGEFLILNSGISVRLWQRRMIRPGDAIPEGAHVISDPEIVSDFFDYVADEATRMGDAEFLRFQQWAVPSPEHAILIAEPLLSMAPERQPWNLQQNNSEGA